MFRQAVHRMLTIMRKDALTGGRDQLVLYMLLSPLVLGLMLALIMPILEDAGPQFVVGGDLDADAIAALRRHGDVEFVGDREAVIARVAARDDVTGVVARGGEEFEVIVEGDEAPALQGLAREIIEHDRRVSTGAVTPEIELVEVGTATAPVRLIATALTGYCVIVVVGLMLGFTILEEKATLIDVALDVSPLRFSEYLAAKLILAVALALGMSVAAIALPLGLRIDWASVLVVVLASVPFAVSLGLIVGVVAKDQLGAVAVMKALLPVWTSLPILGFVLPDAWLWTQWAFANHWGVQGLFHALGDGVGVWRYAGLSLATGAPVLAATAVALRRRLGFG